MNKAIGAALLVVGAVVLFFGLDARDSFSSRVSKAIDGSPSDKAMWLLGIGGFLAVAGVVFLLMRGGKRAIA